MSHNQQDDRIEMNNLEDVACQELPQETDSFVKKNSSQESAQNEKLTLMKFLLFNWVWDSINNVCKNKPEEEILEDIKCSAPAVEEHDRKRLRSGKKNETVEQRLSRFCGRYLKIAYVSHMLSIFAGFTSLFALNQLLHRMEDAIEAKENLERRELIEEFGRIIVVPKSKKLAFKFAASLWVTVLIITELIRVFATSFTTAKTLQISNRFHAALNSMLYEKLVNVRQIQGDDIQRPFNREMKQIYQMVQAKPIWVGYIVQIGLVVFFSFVVLGWSYLFGLIVFGIFLSAHLVLTRTSQNLLKEVDDEKARQMEMVRNISQDVRIFKMETLEEEFKEHMNDERNEEIRLTWPTWYYHSLKNAVLIYRPIFVTVTSIFFHFSIGGTLSIADALTLMILNYWTSFSKNSFRDSFRLVTDGKIALRKIIKFLKIPDTRNTTVQVKLPENPDNLIEFRYKWSRETACVLDSKENKHPFEIKRKQRIFIKGSSGSGKTEFVETMLDRSKIRIDPKTRISYMPQKTWIMNATIKENILCGREFQEARYKEIAMICNLGLLEVEAEDGINSERLSSGQCQYISLARTLYAKSDVYIFDNFLSALDEKTFETILEKLLESKLFKSKTLIFVTNYNGKHTHQWKNIYIKDREVQTESSKSYEKQHSHKFDCDDYKITLPRKIKSVSRESNQSNEDSSKSPIFSRRRNVTDYQITLQTENVQDQIDMAPPQSETDSDDLEVNRRSYKFYIGSSWWYLALIPYFAFGFIHVAIQYKFVQWLFEFSSPQNSNVPKKMTDVTTVNIFLLSEWFPILVIIMLFPIFVNRKSARIFHILLNSYCGAKIHTLLSITTGDLAILFDQSMGEIEKSIPQLFENIVYHVVQAIWSCALIGYLIPWTWETFGVSIVTALVLVIILYYFTWLKFRSTFTMLSLFERDSRGKLETFVQDTVNGHATLIHNQEELCGGMEKKFNEISSRYHSVNWQYESISYWLDIRIDLVCIAFTTLLSVYSVYDAERITEAYAALILVQAFQLNNFLQFIFKHSFKLNSLMMNVEQMRFYTEYFKSEEENDDAEDDNQERIFQFGEIKFDRVSLMYREFSNTKALDDVSFVIAPGQRLAIHGPSGAGKSTIIFALFRLFDCTPKSKITIGGVDIKDYSLKTLRSSLTFVPRKAIFPNTAIRKFLDPLNELDNKKLQDTLDKVGYENENLDDELDFSGSGLKPGTLQRLAIAKGLLRKSKIFIFDEATSLLDEDTETEILNMVDRLEGVTVIIISHRENARKICKQRIEMEDGKIKEITY